MRYYLYLPGGFPTIGTDRDRPRYERHPLLGVFIDEKEAWAAYDRECLAALERIRV